MTNNRKAVLLIAAVLALALIAFALLYSMSQDMGAVYRDSVERAEEAYAKGDYETAVLRYKEAIEEDDTSVPAYEGLSDAYIAMGNYSMARTTLWDGYSRTKSKKLYSRWFQFYEQYPESSDSEKPVDTSINHTLLDRLASGTYQSYERVSSALSKETQRDGSIHVRYREIPGILVFRNSSYQAEAVDGDTIANDAIPEEIKLDDISFLLGGEPPYSRELLESLGASDIFRTQNTLLGSVLQFTMDECTVIVACDANENVNAGAANSVVPTEALRRKKGGAVSDRVMLTGQIIDAQSGEGAGEITIRFRAEGDQVGEVLAESTTNTDGEYEVDLPAGIYTVELSGIGYITDYKEIEIGTYDTEDEENFVVTKELSDGEARIVLEWGSTPTDLDSHLEGETDSGTSFHIFFREKSASDSNGTIADLDLDDTTSYGPETTTIHDLNGRYDFFVHNFTPSTGTLEGSGAKVSVYLPGQPVQVFDVNDGPIDGDYWHVCTIDHGNLERSTAQTESSVREFLTSRTCLE